MKVLYDYQAFELQKFGGISRYFFELFQQFECRESIDWDLPIKYSENEYLTQLAAYSSKLVDKPNDYHKFFNGLNFKGKWSLFRLRNKLLPARDTSIHNQRLSARALQKGDFTVFHPTYYDAYFLHYLPPKPFVLTVHDLIHEKYPEYYAHSSVNRNITQAKRVLINKASKIIAVSENTKKDLISFYGVEEKKVVTIHHGAPEIVKPTHEIPVNNALPERYLLYVGGRGMYKNFTFFLQSVLPLLQEEKDLFVVCTGESFREPEIKLFEELRIKERMVHQPAHEAVVRQLYSRASAFVFPSLYEGFGLPVLEAFNYGCPVVLSRSSSLPEVGGPAAVYFDPHDSEAILNAVTRVVSNPLLRKELIEQGYQQLQKFSWKTTANQTLAVYRSLA